MRTLAGTAMAVYIGGIAPAQPSRGPVPDRAVGVLWGSRFFSLAGSSRLGVGVRRNAFSSIRSSRRLQRKDAQ